MANAFYNVSGAPTTSSPGASSTIRAEFAAIAAGFDKLPATLTANQLVVVNAGGTGLTTTAAPILGTPASGTLTNCTGLPISTGVSGLAAGIATFLATPSSANLKAAVTDETGSGALVFATSPTLVTPVLGAPASGTLTNCTGLPISTGVSGLAAGAATFLATPTSANLLAMLTDETGTGANVFATSPTLVTPLLGTPTSGVLTNCTGLPISTGVSGLAAGIATFLATPSSANLKAAVTDETGSGALVFSTSPALTSPTLTTPTLTSPTATGAVFTDPTAFKYSSPLNVKVYNTTYDGSVPVIQIGGSNDGVYGTFSNNSGSLLSRIDTGTGAYTAVSDANLKTVNPDQTDYLPAIRALWLGDFSWKAGGKPGFGPLAQQAHSLLGNVAATPGDSDTPWTVDPAVFGYLSLWAVQKLLENNDQLLAAIAALEARVALLEGH